MKNTLNYLKTPNRQDALQKIEELSQGNKFFYDRSINRWVCYGYNECKELLSGCLCSKSRLKLPDDILGNENMGKVQRFKDILNNSIIFGNKGSNAYYAQLHKILYKIKVEPLLSKLFDNVMLNNLNPFDISTTVVKFNEMVSNSIFNINHNDQLLMLQARNVGKFFDGKIKNIDEFSTIVSDLIDLVEAFKKIINCNVITESHISFVEHQDDKFIVDCIIIYLASLDTTAHLINYTLLMIIQNNIVVREDNIDKIIWESLRLLSPITSIGRVALKDFEYKNNTIKKDDPILFLVGIANYDNGCFSAPFDFNLNRTVKALSFGIAHSQCIGMNLSISAAKAFLSKFYNTMDGIKFSVVDIGYSFGSHAIGINKLVLQQIDNDK